VVREVTERIRERSRASRRGYLDRIRAATGKERRRAHLACSNLAHTFAAAEGDKAALKQLQSPNVAIVTAYNDMLSAHQPLGTYPTELKLALRQVGAVGQVAGGVPAMCDGITQGEAGMELSLFSRDVIAMATAVALSHDVFDAAICLGVCDKIIPGLLIGALAFGHLPFVFLPAGPMPSGLPNREKQKVRQRYAEGKATKEELLEAESRSYSAPGTCTFFGTANSNQMFMELLGLHLPGASFENPGTPLRHALTRTSAHRAAALVHGGDAYTPIGELFDERALVNAVVGLLATGGSTNHTLHLPAVGRAAGLILTWEDFDDLSAVVPLLAKIYPSGSADVNHFHQAGGIAYMVAQLLKGGLLHGDVLTVAGPGLERYTRPVHLKDGELVWGRPAVESADLDVLRPMEDPFQPTGGLRLLEGNLGRAVTKVSAVKPEHRVVEAPVRVFDNQEGLQRAFQAGELEGDLIAVVRFQGPRANGMPELHKLMAPLGVLLDRGQKVALVTDGRLSGASGKVPAAIHVTPEAAVGGPLARLLDGDRVRLDCGAGVLEVQVDETEWQGRSPAQADLSANAWGMGRELFTGFRAIATPADEGAMAFGV
jgi:phosphogluconate dehydratase